MRRPQGQASIAGGGIFGPGAGFKSLNQWGEADTFTCGHCQRVVVVPPKTDPADMGGLCKQCDSLICPQCVDKAACTPWEKQMEEIEARVKEMEAREAARRSYGLYDT